MKEKSWFEKLLEEPDGDDRDNKTNKKESDKPVMYCTYCGAKVPFDQCSCPKCGMILE
ncbi:MAG: hypothetical protein WCP79_07660 [Bacillota bacterium]